MFAGSFFEVLPPASLDFLFFSFLPPDPIWPPSGWASVYLTSHYFGRKLFFPGQLRSPPNSLTFCILLSTWNRLPLFHQFICVRLSLPFSALLTAKKRLVAKFLPLFFFRYFPMDTETELPLLTFFSFSQLSFFSLCFLFSLCHRGAWSAFFNLIEGVISIVRLV